MKLVAKLAWAEAMKLKRKMQEAGDTPVYIEFETGTLLQTDKGIEFVVGGVEIVTHKVQPRVHE